MSWFTEMAGKAEDFLNKIDANAAVVLQEMEKEEEEAKKKEMMLNSGLTEVKSKE